MFIYGLIKKKSRALLFNVARHPRSHSPEEVICVKMSN